MSDRVKAVAQRLGGKPCTDRDSDARGVWLSVEQAEAIEVTTIRAQRAEERVLVLAEELREAREVAACDHDWIRWGTGNDVCKKCEQSRPTPEPERTVEAIRRVAQFVINEARSRSTLTPGLVEAARIAKEWATAPASSAGGGEPRRWTLSSDYGQFEGLEVVASHEFDAVVAERDERDAALKDALSVAEGFKAERDEARAEAGGLEIVAAQRLDENRELRERVRAFSEALGPFAALGNEARSYGHEGDETCPYRLWARDIYRAEAALASMADSDPEGAHEWVDYGDGDFCANCRATRRHGGVGPDACVAPASSSGGVTRDLAESLEDPDRVAAHQAAALDPGNISRFVSAVTRLGEGGVTPEPHSCDNCDGIDPATCMFNPGVTPEGRGGERWTVVERDLGWYVSGPDHPRGFGPTEHEHEARSFAATLNQGFGPSPVPVSSAAVDEGGEAYEDGTLEIDLGGGRGCTIVMGGLTPDQVVAGVAHALGTAPVPVAAERLEAGPTWFVTMSRSACIPTNVSSDPEDGARWLARGAWVVEIPAPNVDLLRPASASGGEGK